MRLTTISHTPAGGWSMPLPVGDDGPRPLAELVVARPADSRSAGRAVYEIDGQPALPLHKRYLGDHAAGLPGTAGQDGPALALAVSCLGRRTVLGERTEEELEAVVARLSAGTAQVGSYGEICPGGPDGMATDLHGQTMTLTRHAEAA